MPLVATALALFLLELLQRRWQRPWRGAAGVAVAAGFLAAFVSVSGWPRWLPVEASQRLFFLVASVSIASWLLARTPSRWVQLALEAAAVAVMLPLVLQARLEHAWSTQAAIVWLGGLWLAAVAIVRAFGSSLERRDAGLAPLIRLTVVGGIGVILGLSDSFRLAQLAGGLACAMATVELVVWRGRARWDRSDALVAAISLTGLMLVGYFYAGLGSWSAALSVLALLALAVPGGDSKWRQMAPLLPLLIALGLTVAGFLSTEDPYDDYYALVSPGTAGPVFGTANVSAE